MQNLQKKNSFNFRLEPDVEQKLLWLLAFKEDAERGASDRVPSDTFCTMIKQIQSGERGVSCVNPNGRPQTTI